MNILHISNKPVFPTIDGGCVAMKAMLETLLQLTPEVDHVYIHTPRHRTDPSRYPSEIRLPVAHEASFIDTSVSLTGALKGLITGKNYNLSRFYSETFRNEIEQLVRKKSYTLIVLESLFLVPYVEMLRTVSNATIVVRAHNVEYLLWQQQAKGASFLKKWYLKHLAKTLQREEVAGLNQVDLIWTITDEDAALLRKTGVTTNTVTIPVAIEPSENLSDYSNPDFFHIGALNWEPNKLAVQRLLTDIWPWFSHSGSRLHIAGSFPEGNHFPQLPGVDFHGFVENARQFMIANGTLVAPILTGSGVRIKLLEALAMGVPCITTSLGAAGIKDAENVLKVADSDDDWITALTEFASSADLRQQAGEKGRAYIRKYHSFAIVKTLITESLAR